MDRAYDATEGRVHVVDTSQSGDVGTLGSLLDAQMTEGKEPIFSFSLWL